MGEPFYKRSPKIVSVTGNKTANINVKSGRSHINTTRRWYRNETPNLKKNYKRDITQLHIDTT